MDTSHHDLLRNKETFELSQIDNNTAKIRRSVDSDEIEYWDSCAEFEANGGKD